MAAFQFIESIITQEIRKSYLNCQFFQHTEPVFPDPRNTTQHFTFLTKDDKIREEYFLLRTMRRYI